MISPSLDTLFLPLEAGDVPSGGDVLFLGAAGHPFLAALHPRVDFWQPFRPLADTLPAPALSDFPADKTYDLALVNIPKQVEEAKYWIAAALKSLKPSGTLLIAAANDANGNRLEKWLAELGMTGQSLSKNKCRAVWAARPAEKPALFDRWEDGGAVQALQIEDGPAFLTQPGVFGWNKIDQGSALLADHLDGLKGIGADFGSGTGFLSYNLLNECDGVKTLHLCEADSRALALSKLNLTEVAAERTLHFHWADLAGKISFPTPLDFIIMNPPFHAGAKTDIGLGKAFIATAAAALRKGGVLRLVANRQLPYENPLRDLFTGVRSLTDEDGFKVLEAVK